MASFAEGLGGSLQQQASQNQENMFRTALLSKQIEMESQARMAEQEHAHELNMVQPEQAGALAGLMGAPKEAISALTANGPISSEILGKGLEALGMQARANSYLNKPVKYESKPDADNLITYGYINPMTGQPMPGPNGVPSLQKTLDLPAHNEILKVDNQVTNATNMIGQMSKLGQSLLTSAPVDVPLQKLNAYWQSHGMPTNPNLKAFLDTQGALSAQYIKDTTGMAPRSQQLMEMDMNAFPNATDDVQSALQKAQILNNVMLNKAGTAHSLYDPSDFLKSPFHPKTQGQQVGVQAADANQMHTTSKGTKYIVSQ